MRILLYSDHFDKKSGYAREMKLVMEEFIKAGHEIAYLALGYNGIPLPTRTDVKVYPAKVEGETSYYGKHMLMYALDDFKPDVVFTRQDYYALPQIAFTLARPRGHVWVHWGLADGEPLGKNLDEPIRWVNQHIFNTPFTKSVVQAQNSAIQGPIISPPIDTSFWVPQATKDELRAKYGIPEEKKVIVCVARNQVRKNIPCLLESVAHLKADGEDVQLILVSHDTITPSGDTAGYDISHLIRFFGLEEDVLLPGSLSDKMLDDEALREIYTIGDVFALPTMGEGYGLIYMEAALMGLPIVTTGYAGGADAVGDLVCNLVKPIAYVWDADNVKQAIVDPREFADHIKNVLEDDMKRDDVIKYTKKALIGKNPQAVASQLLNVMEETLKNQTKPIALQ